MVRIGKLNGYIRAGIFVFPRKAIVPVLTISAWKLVEEFFLFPNGGFAQALVNTRCERQGAWQDGAFQAAFQAVVVCFVVV